MGVIRKDSEVITHASILLYIDGMLRASIGLFVRDESDWRAIPAQRALARVRLLPAMDWVVRFTPKSVKVSAGSHYPGSDAEKHPL